MVVNCCMLALASLQDSIETPCSIEVAQKQRMTCRQVVLYQNLATES